MTATTRRPAGTSDTPRTTSPRADCTADSAGGLSFDIRLPDTAPPGAVPSAAVPSDAAERWDAALLLRLRKSDPEESVRLPLVPSSGGTVLRAALPSTVPLAEGRWDAYLRLGDGEPQRLLPGCNDLRSLVDRIPRTDRTWLGVRIPYTTKYGNLSVRAWLRWPHAEAGEVWPRDGGVTVHGRLYGAELTPTARLEARPHGVPPPDAPTVTGPVTPGGGHGFTARLAYRDLVREPGTEEWDLWLRPGEDAEPVRLARILDDIADKQKILRYPAQAVIDKGPGEESLWARPYYTGDNDLSMRLERSP
ncbi:MAG TPA: hypothetical protein VFY14_00290 [Streptomyces sp.]|nr:hypothetical protein [Streptomyces sp.]